MEQVRARGQVAVAMHVERSVWRNAMLELAQRLENAGSGAAGAALRAEVARLCGEPARVKEVA